MYVEHISFSVRMLIPFICATFIAQRVGEFFNEGLYDIHNGLSGVPILPWTPPVGARLMSVSEFMTSPVVCFTERVRMREVWEALCFTCHNAFPVVRYPPDQGTRPYQKRFGKFYLAWLHFLSGFCPHFHCRVVKVIFQMNFL